jgi:ubiquinone/menaquinone biosynthesis C-methylase UbiE
MEPLDIAAAYDEIADTWRNDRFNPDEGIAQHELALRFLKQGEHSLNVGCGCNSRFNELFRRSGLTVEGVDFSSRMIELAQLGDPLAIYHHVDICSWDLPKNTT